jgi:hypothetical protein
MADQTRSARTVVLVHAARNRICQIDDVATAPAEIADLNFIYWQE